MFTNVLCIVHIYLYIYLYTRIWRNNQTQEETPLNDILFEPFDPSGEIKLSTDDSTRVSMTSFSLSLSFEFFFSLVSSAMIKKNHENDLKSFDVYLLECVYI